MQPCDSGTAILKNEPGNAHMNDALYFTVPAAIERAKDVPVHGGPGVGTCTTTICSTSSGVCGGMTVYVNVMSSVFGGPMATKCVPVQASVLNVKRVAVASFL